MPERGSAREVLNALRERYRAGSGGIVATVTALAGELAAAPQSPEVIETIRREAHRIRGTAGTYGFADASQLAEALERRCELWAADEAADAGHRAVYVEQIAAKLSAAFAPPTSDER